MPETAKQGERTPHPEARFPSDVVAANVRGLRALRGDDQEELAGVMRHLRFGWSRATVSEVERGDRKVTVDELAGLAVAFNVSPTELLDPDRLGVHLDLGMTGPVRKNLASAWARGLLRIGIEGDKYSFERTLDHLDPVGRGFEALRMMAREEEQP